MPEQFQVIFNSRGSNVVSSNGTDAARTNILYSMNWASILPRKYKRFQCQFTFKSEQIILDSAVGRGSMLTETALLGLSTPSYNYDGNSRVNNIGLVAPVCQYLQVNYTSGVPSQCASQSYFSATVNDNNSFYMDYPKNNQINITLNKTDGTGVLSTCPHYVLMLSFIGIPETSEMLDNQDIMY